MSTAIVTILERARDIITGIAPSMWPSDGYSLSSGNCAVEAEPIDGIHSIRVFDVRLIDASRHIDDDFSTGYVTFYETFRVGVLYPHDTEGGAWRQMHDVMMCDYADIVTALWNPTTPWSPSTTAFNVTPVGRRLRKLASGLMLLEIDMQLRYAAA